MGKKDDAFVLKERGVVTTTIQGGSYNPGRLIYEDDTLAIRGNDYNNFYLSFKVATAETKTFDYSDNSKGYETLKTVFTRAKEITISLLQAGRCGGIAVHPDAGDYGSFACNNIAKTVNFSLTLSTESAVTPYTLTFTLYGE